MSNVIRIFFVLSLILCVATPFTSRAASVDRPYGGYVTLAFMCTCSFGWLVYFAPLHPVTYPYITHSLVWQIGVSIPYPYLVLPTPTSWELGMFLPRSGECLVYSGDTCITYGYPDGEIIKAGASFPGYTI